MRSVRRPDDDAVLETEVYHFIKYVLSRTIGQSAPSATKTGFAAIQPGTTASRADVVARARDYFKTTYGADLREYQNRPNSVAYTLVYPDVTVPPSQSQQSTPSSEYSKALLAFVTLVHSIISTCQEECPEDTLMEHLGSIFGKDRPIPQLRNATIFDMVGHLNRAGYIIKRSDVVDAERRRFVTVGLRACTEWVAPAASEGNARDTTAPLEAYTKAVLAAFSAGNPEQAEDGEGETDIRSPE